MNASERGRAEKMVKDAFNAKRVRASEPQPPAALKRAVAAVEKSLADVRAMAAVHGFTIEWPYRERDKIVVKASYDAPLSIEAREAADAANAALEERVREIIADIWDGKHSFDSLNKALKRA